MNRKLTCFLLIFMFFLLTACEKDYDDRNNYAPGGDNPNESETIPLNAQTRKMIYTANVRINTKDILKSNSDLKAKINADEWFDYENITEKNAQFTIRIKTTRLDSFLESLSDIGIITSLNKVGTDISLTYSNTANRILSFEAERARLIVLYQNAAMHEMINLNIRISEIDQQLVSLQQQLNNYDSLIEYSEVKLTITQVPELLGKTSFGMRASNTFIGGWNVLFTLLEGIALIIIALFPFAVVFGPIGFGVYYLVKRKNRKIKTSEIKNIL